MGLARHVWGNVKIGVLVFLTFGLIAYFITGAYGMISAPTSAFFSNPYLHALSLIFAAYSTGVILTNRFTKTLLNKLSQYRYLAFLRYFLIGHIKHMEFPEVMYWKGGDVYGLGNVMSEWQDNGGIEWCRVTDPTYPSAVTGFLGTIKKEKLIYTGRSFKDTAITALSLGTK